MLLTPAITFRTNPRRTLWLLTYAIVALFGSMPVGLFAQSNAKPSEAQEKSNGTTVYCEAPEDGEAPSPTSAGYQLLMGAADARGEISRIDVPANPLRGSSKSVSKKTTAPTSIPSLPQIAATKPPAAEKANDEEVKSIDESNQSSKIAVESSTKVGEPEPMVDVETKDKSTSVTAHAVDRKKHDSQEMQESPKISDLALEDEDVESALSDNERRIQQVQVPVLEISHAKKSKDDSKDRAPTEIARFSRQQLAMRDRIESCLAYYLTRPESVAKRSPWAVMHGMLPFGVEANVVAGTKQVNAIGWMCFNGKCRTQRLFIPKGDSFAMSVGPGVQGHEGQFLAMLAQSYVPSSYAIQVEQKNYQVADLVEYEMRGCKEGTELTFKLIGLSHYLKSDQQWVTPDRKKWNIAKLIEEELAQPIVGAACGGTHRLMGLTYAVQRRTEQGLPITGQFLRAQQFTTDFIPYAFSLQNPDGSFSTDWFERRANEPDLDRKVQTTGHILEWIVYTLPEDDLDDPRVIRAVQFLLSQLLDDRGHDWAIGPRGHSLRALALYDQRVFGRSPGKMREELVQAKQVRNNPRR